MTLDQELALKGYKMGRNEQVRYASNELVTADPSISVDVILQGLPDGIKPNQIIPFLAIGKFHKMRTPVYRGRTVVTYVNETEAVKVF